MAEDAFIAFLNDRQSRNLVQNAKLDAKVQNGSVRNAAWEFRSKRSPGILLVDLDGEQNPIVYVPALIQVCRPESIILVTGSENNVALANELYRSGVFLYLPKPLDTTNLAAAMREVAAVNGEGARPDIQASRLLPVLGKGMGTNTMTALLARMAAEAGRYVSCVDLDPNFGSLAMAFDTEPRRGLAQALQAPGGDASVLERLQAPVSPRIGLVAHPVDQSGQDSFAEEGLGDLIDALVAQAHMILLCGLQPRHVDMLRHTATSHVIVFEPTPAGVSVAVRWLRILDGAQSTLVVNHTRPLPKLLSNEQLRTGFGGRSPDFELPYIKGMARSMALGEPESALSRRERTLLGNFLQPLLGLGADQIG